ncbi:dihydroxyacetone kinase phosphoryl donor subunit DhaM [Heyndrickxia sp. NPDC080065]|uniref:dihydroxyacetone kinase phosphoryl donor subunit DhaM n=1 Tax=Heyndrickxia sp. NPDC080065 TaxID=3390568 RepID=UPI003D001609
MDHVGIVLISHSIKVVEGIKDIISQVVDNVPIELAGGTDDNEIGTSVDKILSAIDRAYSEKGVILLFDLGSAMMNAEMAIEMSEHRKIKIAEDIPLLEGAYIAAVESGMGKEMEQILKYLKDSF